VGPLTGKDISKPAKLIFVGAGFTPARKGHFKKGVVGPVSIRLSSSQAVPAICFPGDYFSYHTIVIPDEIRYPVDCRFFPGFRISTCGGFRNDVIIFLFHNKKSGVYARLIQCLVPTSWCLVFPFYCLLSPPSFFKFAIRNPQCFSLCSMPYLS
jgi:hypothetical protein